MQQIKVQTPAKINLTLEILGKRPDGFHNIQSIMHTISLCDFLTFRMEDCNEEKNIILLKGTSHQIPYDDKNIVFKAINLYLQTVGVSSKKIEVFIEKNIPVSAGLAGGSTNASGAFLALNELFDRKLDNKQLHMLASQLGSDLNFCLNGGCALCTGRGEIIESLPFIDFELSLIKPKNIGISAKEAYQKYALLQDKTFPDNTLKLRKLLEENRIFDKSLIYNSLEKAILPAYESLQKIKNKVPSSLMSGSGSTFFVIEDKFGEEWALDDFDIFNNLTSVNYGVKTV